MLGRPPAAPRLHAAPSRGGHHAREGRETIVPAEWEKMVAGELILPGIRIGARVVIGAGSVVSRDVQDDTFAAGNPCRVIREIARTSNAGEHRAV